MGRIIDSPREIYGMDVVPSCNGLEVQIDLSSEIDLWG